MQIPLQWGKLKFSVSIKVEPRLTNLYGGFGLSYSRVATVTMPTLSGAMVVL